MLVVSVIFFIVFVCFAKNLSLVFNLFLIEVVKEILGIIDFVCFTKYYFKKLGLMCAVCVCGYCLQRREQAQYKHLKVP